MAKELSKKIVENHLDFGKSRNSLYTTIEFIKAYCKEHKAPLQRVEQFAIYGGTLISFRTSSFAQ